MKNRTVFPLGLVLAASLFIIACGGSGNDNDVRRQARETLPQPQTAAPAVNPPAMNNVAAATPAGGTVNHYICPNNCEGSGGASQVACPVCGTMYVHNQAFHQQQTATSPQTNIGQEPAQNTAGVWHYTCPSGCEGGAGSATACANCGATLTHNAAYHQ